MAFLRRLEEDRTRGFLRASAWAATQRLGGGAETLALPEGGAPNEETHAGVSGPPAV